MTSIAIIEAVNTSAIQFKGQPVITAMAAGVVYVAMKPIVENLGMSWSTQLRKLNENKDKYNCAHMNMVAMDKKLRDVLCIPLKKLNGWLFSINPSKVRDDIRDKLITYQEECFCVLYEYWTTGEVKKKPNFRQSTAKELIPLRQTAERLIAHGVGNIYPDIWKHVHAEFGVQHINELLPEQIPQAISYLDALEGEYIPKQDALPEPVGITFTEDETLALVTMCNAANFAQQEAKAMYPAFVEFGSRFTGTIYDIAHSNGIFVRNGTKVLMDKLSGLRLSGKAWAGALNRLTMNA